MVEKLENTYINNLLRVCYNFFFLTTKIHENSTNQIYKERCSTKNCIHT